MELPIIIAFSVLVLLLLCQHLTSPTPEQLLGWLKRNNELEGQFCTLRKEKGALESRLTEVHHQLNMLFDHAFGDESTAKDYEENLANLYKTLDAYASVVAFLLGEKDPTGVHSAKDIATAQVKLRALQIQQKLLTDLQDKYEQECNKSSPLTLQLEAEKRKVQELEATQRILDQRVDKLRATVSDLGVLLNRHQEMAQELRTENSALQKTNQEQQELLCVERSRHQAELVKAQGKCEAVGFELDKALASQSGLQTSVKELRKGLEEAHSKARTLEHDNERLGETENNYVQLLKAMDLLPMTKIVTPKELLASAEYLVGHWKSLGARFQTLQEDRHALLQPLISTAAANGGDALPTALQRIQVLLYNEQNVHVINAHYAKAVEENKRLQCQLDETCSMLTSEKRNAAERTEAYEESQIRTAQLEKANEQCQAELEAYREQLHILSEGHVTLVQLLTGKTGIVTHEETLQTVNKLQRDATLLQSLYCALRPTQEWLNTWAGTIEKKPKEDIIS